LFGLIAPTCDSPRTTGITHSRRARLRTAARQIHRISVRHRLAIIGRDGGDEYLLHALVKATAAAVEMSATVAATTAAST
jgi:hypothetical protein